MLREAAATFAFFLAMPLAACVGGPVATGAGEFLSERGLTGAPVPGAFDYCWDHSCNRRARLSLSDEVWGEIARPLDEPSASAEGERARLREAVAAFEGSSGSMAGTSAIGAGP